MPRCPHCTGEAPEGSRFCPACAGPLDAGALSPTRTSFDHRSSKLTFPAGSDPSVAQSRFLPGALVAGRYRIVGLLGRGGMGEVYRADDLKLGQAVALKFLPEGLDRDEKRLGLLLGEVRTARQVTHASVCRVYDVGEIDGQHYLSMEYVDGEDLASLLRRVGRLPQDRAVQVARELCAGLAAAHEQRILHRDLKPANVMIDGRGRAKITDFGLAGLERTEIRSGTPAYMAPEQLAGREISVQSDIYSLGLVLYELFTGKPAFPGGTPAEVSRSQSESTPTSPTTHVGELDGAIERIILRCLSKEPGERPASALAVAAALPGGDPLAAALAAGETPSPAMIADSGSAEGLRPGVAFSCLAVVLVGIVGLTWWWAPRLHLVAQVPLDKPPQLLVAEARRLIEAVGYTEPPADRAWGFAVDSDHLERLRKEAPPQPAARRDFLEGAHPSPIHFWYRQSPRSLVPTRAFGSVAPDNPAVGVSGMVNAGFDSRGRLIDFLAIPPQVDAAEGPPPRLDWAPLIQLAGFEPERLEPARPTWTPLATTDVRAAWTGAYAERPDQPVRVEAAAYGGRPVFFKVVAPWTRPERMQERERPAGTAVVRVTLLVLLVSILVGGALLARRNLRLGRGDRRGAFRLALFILALVTLSQLLDLHHVPSFAEVALLFFSFALGLLLAVVFWVVYLAVEPYARRLWPECLITWSRLLDGRFSDPRLGRDILVGGVAAVGFGLALVGYQGLFKPAMGLRPAGPVAAGMWALEGPHRALEWLVDTPQVLQGVLGTLMMLVLFRLVLRRRWAAVVAMLVVLTSLSVPQLNDPAFDIVFEGFESALFLFVLIRVGLFAGISFAWFANFYLQVPLTFDLTSWYAIYPLLIMLVPIAAAIYGFRIALAGRPLLAEDLLEEGANP